MAERERIEVRLVEYSDPQWVTALSEEDRATYDQARQDSIEQKITGIRTTIEEHLPGVTAMFPDGVETLALRWATGAHNSWVMGVQDAKSHWEI